MASLIPADETEEIQDLDTPEDPAEIEILVGGPFVRFRDDYGGLWIWRSPPWGYVNTRVLKWVNPSVNVQGVCLYLSSREASIIFAPSDVPEWMPQKSSALAGKRSRVQDLTIDDMVANFQPKRRRF